jgi:response regulator of citrate/malate metabolism
VSVQVLVVEDEQIAAEAHRTYVERVPGFAVCGVARSFQEAVRMLRTSTVDLLLLDMHLPDGHGLDLLRQLRALGQPIDVIAVTSTRDVEVVRAAATLGVVAYLLKPFTFAMLRTKLEQYRTYRDTLAPEQAVDQESVDAVFGAMRPPATGAALPKGLSPETLDAVRAALVDSDQHLSAGEVAALIGASRVTARRYLEHLAETGVLVRTTRYGGSGRPQVEYRRVSR